MDEKLLEFINDEKKRHKDNTPNLGVLMVYTLLSEKITIK